MTSPPPASEPVLVSACLLGHACRHDGGHKRSAELLRELELRDMQPVPFCPEEHGGLGTPRPSAWIESADAGSVVDGTDRVVDVDARDVTAAFLRGASGALELCRARGIRRAFLKERSPSCGVACTHVAGLPTDGRGVTAETLARAGIELEGVR